jgi:3-deoxy-manno-octulosonate cytidylyltransferase (CMP-KDO synthetase)
MHSNQRPRVIAVIPARFGSSRFPGKVIAPLAGKPLVAHVYERTLKASTVDEIVIAVDDRRVQQALEPWGAATVMTRPDHRSGTDRVAEAVSAVDADVVVNVQGDEPLIDPRLIDQTVQALLSDADAVMATARRPILDDEEARNPNVVKVVCDKTGRALYFSRSLIPHVREQGDSLAGLYWQHIGLYVFRRPFLMEFAALEATPLEQAEKLEQLRALEHGRAIVVVDTDYESVGVDAPEDLERVEALLVGKKV